MRQRLEIIVMTSVDPDEWIPNEKRNVYDLQDKITEAVKSVTGDKHVMIEVEYGEPV